MHLDVHIGALSLIYWLGLNRGRHDNAPKTREEKSRKSFDYYAGRDRSLRVVLSYKLLAVLANPMQHRVQQSGYSRALAIIPRIPVIQILASACEHLFC